MGSPNKTTKVKRYDVKFYICAGITSTILVCLSLFFLVQITNIDGDIADKLISKKGWVNDIRNNTKNLREISSVYINEIMGIVDKLIIQIDDFIDQYLHLSYNSVKQFDKDLGVSKTLDEIKLAAEMSKKGAEDMSKVSKDIKKWVLEFISAIDYDGIINSSVVKDDFIRINNVLNMSNILQENAKYLEEMVHVGKVNFYKLDYRIYSFYGDYAAPYVKLVKEMMEEIIPQITLYKKYLFSDYLGELRNLEISLTEHEPVVVDYGYAAKYLNYICMLVPLVIIFILFGAAMAVSFMRIKSTDDIFTPYIDQCNRSINIGSICGYLVIFFLATIVFLSFSLLSFAYTDGCQCTKRLLGNPGDPMNKEDIKRISKTINLESFGLPVTFEDLLVNFYDNQTIFSSLEIMSFIQDHLEDLELDIKNIINLLPRFIGIFWINFSDIHVFEMNPIQKLEQNMELLTKLTYFENFEKIDCIVIKDLFHKRYGDISKPDETKLCSSLKEIKDDLLELSNVKKLLFTQLARAILETKHLNDTINIKDSFNPVKNLERNDQLLTIFSNVTNEMAELGAEIFSQVMKLPDILSHENTGMRPLIDTINSFLTVTICDDIVWTLDGLWFCHCWFLVSLFTFINISKFIVRRSVVMDIVEQQDKTVEYDEFIDQEIYPKNFVEFIDQEIYPKNFVEIKLNLEHK